MLKADDKELMDRDKLFNIFDYLKQGLKKNQLQLYDMDGIKKSINQRDDIIDENTKGIFPQYGATILSTRCRTVWLKNIH